MTLRRAIRRLRLKPGDIVILRDPMMLQRVMEAGKHAELKFNVPIVVVPDKHGIKVKHG
jgi:hypothetical protein